jgi:uncharacterized protein (DUF1501 family)
VDRRQFLTLLAAAPCYWLLGRPVAAADAQQRTLVLVELKGGNDGLNTVVPLEDDVYRRLRPRLALAAKDVFPVAPAVWLHGALAPLVPSWRDGQLAIVQGVGYPEPNLSHFRSSDIWSSAAPADPADQEGWVAKVWAERVVGSARVGGIVIGRNDGPVASLRMRSVVVADAAGLHGEQGLRNTVAGRRRTAALEHVLEVQAGVEAAGRALRASVAGVEVVGRFPPTEIGSALREVARMIIGRLGVPVMKVELGGFDTHVEQAGRHALLLGQLAEALAAFRASLVTAGRWSDVVVMTQSEFGRRPAENANRGTDHGTAAPVLLLGGRVRGGMHGVAPRLDRLVAGNLAHTTDFRSVYQSIVVRHWQMDVQRSPFAAFPLLEVI